MNADPNQTENHPSPRSRKDSKIVANVSRAGLENKNLSAMDEKNLLENNCTVVVFSTFVCIAEIATSPGPDFAVVLSTLAKSNI